ncbi:MAG: methylated-DNA--[protein]-cysteine S-methyltransferase [Proteobacteria bacterium]|nr:methylated-DNA--[protein]-cysteine S-methyltransferase [Pseudomonadota bacterium]
MSSTSYALFATPIGDCAIVWGTGGIVGTSLPAATPAASRALLQRRYPAAQEAPPPAAIAQVIDAIRALLAGEPRDLLEVPLDMARIASFERRVYEAARAIPPGRTLTYGELAARIGAPTEARAVGQALGANPYPIVVPCHRILGAGGRSGGFSAPGGTRTKLRLLEIERAVLGDGPGLFD